MSTTVKTAISIDAGTFHKVEQLSRKLHISRSQFFTQAARHMVDRSEDLELLRRINEAYAPDQSEAQQVAEGKAYSGRKVGSTW